MKMELDFVQIFDGEIQLCKCYNTTSLCGSINTKHMHKAKMSNQNYHKKTIEK